MIDRIYDTLIDEDELRICDETIHKIADELEPRPYSSREFIREMGGYLKRTGLPRHRQHHLTRPTNRTSRSSSPPSATVPPASASSPTSTAAAIAPKSRSTAPRISTN